MRVNRPFASLIAAALSATVYIMPVEAKTPSHPRKIPAVPHRIVEDMAKILRAPGLSQAITACMFDAAVKNQITDTDGSIYGNDINCSIDPRRTALVEFQVPELIRGKRLIFQMDIVCNDMPRKLGNSSNGMPVDYKGVVISLQNGSRLNAMTDITQRQDAHTAINILNKVLNLLMPAALVGPASSF
jgi:hypothetical protein